MDLIFCDTKELTDEQYLEYEKITAPETIARAIKMRFEKDRRSTVAGEGIVRMHLSSIMGIPASEINITRTDKGKPFCKDGLHFNISHSDGCVVTAFSEKIIGVDIEKLKTPKYETMRRFCTESEKIYVESSYDDSEKEKRYFEIWTLKEAYLKCTGEGLSGGLLSVSFTLENGIAVCSDNRFKCKIIYAYEGFIISVCELL